MQLKSQCVCGTIYGYTFDVIVWAWNHTRKYIWSHSAHVKLHTEIHPTSRWRCCVRTVHGATFGITMWEKFSSRKSIHSASQSVRELYTDMYLALLCVNEQRTVLCHSASQCKTIQGDTFGVITVCAWPLRGHVHAFGVIVWVWNYTSLCVPGNSFNATVCTWNTFVYT